MSLGLQWYYILDLFKTYQGITRVIKVRVPNILAIQSSAYSAWIEIAKRVTSSSIELELELADFSFKEDM